MNRELGFSNTVFGLGAGFFSIGYVIFSVPGTLLMRRVGAREWLALSLVLCGLCSAAMSFVRTPFEFYLVRTFLGMAEASLVPTMIAYFGRWLPSEYRGRAVGAFLLVTPFALLTAGPASAALLELHGFWGFSGWQWLFLIEAIPPIMIAPILLAFLSNRPDQAKWLSEEQRSWLLSRLAADESGEVGQEEEGGAAWTAFTSHRMLILAAVSVGFGIANAGPLFFLPLIISSMGFSTMSIGFLSALPAVVAGFTLPFWGRWTDRVALRENVMIVAGLVVALGFVLTAIALPSPWAFVGLTFVSAGLYGASVSNVLLPLSFLRGSAAAAGIALTSTSISLGTFLGSYLIGMMSDRTGAFIAPMVALCGVVIVSIVLLRLSMMRKTVGPYRRSPWAS